MKKFALTALAFVFSTTAFGATDWTPYVKGMQNSCNNDLSLMLMGGYDARTDKEVAPKIPRQLKASIKSSKDGKFILTNATAFGLLLKSISFAVDDESGNYSDATLTFGAGIDKILPQFTISDGKRTAKVGTNAYWLNVKRERSDTKTLETHSVPYYSDQMGAEMHFGYHLKRSDYLSDSDAKTSYNKLSKNFHKHQAPILNKLLKKYGNQDELKLTTYVVNKAGYEVSEGGHAWGLEIDKAKKQIRCYDIYFGDIKSPKYLNQ